MFLLKVIAFLPLVFAFPDLQVNWSGGEHSAVRVVAEGKEGTIDQCIESGLEVRYRYELRLCRRRTLWADYCKDSRITIHAVQYDPISESYKVAMDTLSDGYPPKVVTFLVLEDALRAVTTLSSPPLKDMGYNSDAFPSRRDPYIGVRVITDCKGDYNETMARISNFLTLGLLEIGSFDSGWSDFSLTK